MAIPITEITDHNAQAKARLPGWLVDATNLQAFIDVLVTPVQDVERLFNELLNEVSIETAVGVQLDVIGIILDLERASATEPDEEYRNRLLGQSASLSQSGEPEAVIAAWSLIWIAVSVLLVEFQPATLELTAFVESDVEDDGLDAAAIDAMEKVIAGGVGTILQLNQNPAFLFGDSVDADANGDIPVSPNGFGSSADADANGDILPGVGGGNFARVLI